MTRPIPVPPRAAAKINDLVQRRGALEAELQNAVALLLAALGAPDDWQVRVNADGSMIAVAPEPPPKP